MTSLVTAFGVFHGVTRAVAEAKLRLAVTTATGREPTAADAAAITLLRGYSHPIFGDTSEMSPEAANEAATLFCRLHD